MGLVSKFSCTARYTGGLFCIYDTFFSQYLYFSQIDDQGLHWIYPELLTLNCAQESREQISFLDVLTFRDGNIRCNKTFDKREAQIDPDSTTNPGFMTTKWNPPQTYPCDHSKRAESEGKSDFIARARTGNKKNPFFHIYIYICTQIWV